MNPRETAIKLLTQAVDGSVTPEEARTFALKAVKIIAEHKLLGNGATTGVGSTIGGKIGAFLSQLPVEEIVRNVNGVALGASALEILSLKAEIQRLEVENSRLRTKKKLRRQQP